MCAHILAEQTRCNSIYYVADRLNKPIRDVGGWSIYRIHRYNTTTPENNRIYVIIWRNQTVFENARARIGQLNGTFRLEKKKTIVSLFYCFS